jgi:hypothetical protein
MGLWERHSLQIDPVLASNTVISVQAGQGVLAVRTFDPFQHFPANCKSTNQTIKSTK